MVYEFKVKKANGSEVFMKEFEGKALLIVNVASECGFTKQYEGLQALYEKYHPKGLEIIGFPCNQFGGQEPKGSQEIAQFCMQNYGVEFLLMQKVDVNGDQAHPLFSWLKSQAPGLLNTEGIKWNFTKFLVGRKGQVIKRYAPQDNPESIASDIEAALIN